MKKHENIMNYKVYSFLTNNKQINSFVFLSIKDFLDVFLDNIRFVLNYFTIIDGIFSIHKSRFNEQTDHDLY